MKTPTLIILFYVAALFPVQAGTIGVDPTNGGTAFVGGVTLGWEFEVTATNGIVVDGLGFWDYQSDFFGGQTFPVGLWEASTGILLRNSTITSGSTLVSSLHPDGDWRVNSVPPVFLAPGLYRIGVYMPDIAANQIVDDSGISLQSESGIGLVRYLRQVGSSKLAMPDIPPPTPDFGYFGPTFTYTIGPGTGTTVTAGAVVAPSNYTATAGTGGLNTLLRENGFPRTYQMGFSPSALGVPVGARITELRFRLRTNTTPVVSFPPTTTTWADYEVTLAQTANTIPGMSTNFAANMLSPVLVKDGPLTINADSFTTSAGLNPFCPFIVFDTPYIYRGGNLVILFSHTGSDSITNSFFDASNSSGVGYGVTFRALTANGFNAVGGAVASLIIPQIVYTPPITSTTLLRDGSDMVIAGTGGAPGWPCYVMMSTNIALPMSQWMLTASGYFDGNSNFNFTNPITGGSQFFRIATP